MIRLTSTDLISLITAQNGARVVVSYSDATGSAYTGGTQPTSITSATTTTICSSPAASIVRDIDFINIKNTFAGSHTITVQLNVSATLYVLVTMALLTDESLSYTHGSGWCAIDANGNRKEVTSSIFSSITDTGLTATRVVYAGTGGLLSDDSGFTFNTTGDILTAGAINLAGTTAPTTGWYNPSGTLLRTPNATTIDGAVTASSTLSATGATTSGTPSSASTGNYQFIVANGIRDVAIEYNAANASPAAMTFLKSRGTSGTPADVSASDILGSLLANGYRNGAYRAAGRINFIVDSLGASDVTSHIEFAPASAGTATVSLSAYPTGLVFPILGSFAAGDKYLIVDASGNVHVSALGPAS